MCTLLFLSLHMGKKQIPQTISRVSCLVFRKKDLYLIIRQKLTFMKSGGFHLKSGRFHQVKSSRFQVKSTQNLIKSDVSTKTLQFGGSREGAMTPDFMKSGVIAPLLHSSNWIVEKIPWISCEIHQISWNPVDFMRISCNPADFMKATGFHVKSKDHLQGILTLGLMMCLSFKEAGILNWAGWKAPVWGLRHTQPNKECQVPIITRL